MRDVYAERASRPLAYTGVLSAGNLMLIAPPLVLDAEDHLMEVVQRMMRRGSPTK